MRRARRIERFLSQNMMAAEQFTGQPGSTVPLKETIEAFDKLTKGEFDHLPEQAFFLIGGLEDLQTKAESLGAKIDDGAGDGAPSQSDDFDDSDDERRVREQGQVFRRRIRTSPRRRTTTPIRMTEMADLDVDIVAVEREIWSGKASFVFTRTTSGGIGILPRHIPLVAQLVDDAMVRVERDGADDMRIAVDGGFISVTDAGMTILAESAEFESEIDAEAAQSDCDSDDADTAAGGGRGCGLWARSTSGPP